MGGGGNRRGIATTSWTRGLIEAKWEATVQREVRPHNSNERQRRQQMGSGGVRRGDATTSQNRGMGGHGAMRGDSVMRGKSTGRWEAVA